MYEFCIAQPVHQVIDISSSVLLASQKSIILDVYSELTSDIVRVSLNERTGKLLAVTIREH